MPVGRVEISDLIDIRGGSNGRDGGRKTYMDYGYTVDHSDGNCERVGR